MADQPDTTLAIVTLFSIAIIEASPAGAATFRVSLQSSNMSVTVGNTVYARGSVSPVASKSRIDLLYYSSYYRKYVKASTYYTATGGTFAIPIRPGAPGIWYYKTCKAPIPGYGWGCSTPITIRSYKWNYLYDLNDVGANGVTRYSSVQMNGTTYLKNIVFYGGSGVFYSEYNLSRKCSLIAGVQGVEDTQSSNSKGTFSVISDGNLRYARQVAFGSTQAFNVNISGALRLRLEGVNNSGRGVWLGGVRIYCLW